MATGGEQGETSRLRAGEFLHKHGTCHSQYAGATSVSVRTQSGLGVGRRSQRGGYPDGIGYGMKTGLRQVSQHNS